jgi:hypothetical protein
MTTWVLILATVTVGGVGVRIWYRRWRKRRIAARRRVEKPNSHYSSLGVKNQIDRERWAGIEDQPLHPVNREEVVRLLEIVDTLGIDALSKKEREFLDNMARPRSASPSRRRGKIPPSATETPRGSGDPDPLPRPG